MDADIIPSRIKSFTRSFLDNLFSVLNELNLNTYNKTVFVIPLFQFTKKYRNRCQNSECFEKMVLTIPSTTNELFQCIERNICQIGNAHLNTHVRALYIMSILVVEVCVKRLVL